jgi:acyl-CoA thioesterase I
MPIIVALGDSTTAGTPLYESPIEAPPSGRGDERSQYAYWLVKAHPSWQVLNRGVNGERSDQIRARFDRDVLAQRPDGVVIIAGVNDSYQGRPADRVTAELGAMYDRAAGAGLWIVAGSILPYNTATPDQNARMHAVNAWIAAEAARYKKFSVVDTRRAVAASGDHDRLAGSPDGLHPDIEGYRRMAEALAPAIERALAGR